MLIKTVSIDIEIKNITNLNHVSLQIKLIRYIILC